MRLAPYKSFGRLYLLIYFLTFLQPVYSQSELPIDEGSLPLAVKLSNVRVRSWQGTPDLTVDRSEQVEVLDKIPWEAIDASSHSVEVDFSDLLNGGSRSGVTSIATVVSVQSGSGIILSLIHI